MDSVILDPGMWTGVWTKTWMLLSHIWGVSQAEIFCGSPSQGRCTFMNKCVIQWLDMFNNAIGDEGARVILQSAVNNEACQTNIDIDDEYSRESEVATGIDGHRRRMKTELM